MKTWIKPAQRLVLSLVCIVTFSTCNKDDDNAIPSCSPFNLFSLSQDIELGQQLEAEIASDPTTYPVLDETQYASSYAYLNQMRDRLLASPAIRYRNEFAWKLRIIRDDNTLNAFCAPGGYIYVYTGLIKYLDREDDLAGVLGHEIAHADRRHSTEQLTREYGFETLLSIVTGGDPSLLAQVANSLVGLSYSRCNETEADAYSVDYLASTGVYSCIGTASFFEKLSEDGSSGGPEFLSTHPNPDDRVEAINARADEINCNKAFSTGDSYAQFKATLP